MRILKIPITLICLFKKETQNHLNPMLILPLIAAMITNMDDYNRRHFIRTSLPGFLGLGLALPGITAFATRANACDGRVPENGAINWDAFLTAVEKEASKQHLDHWDQAAYVKQAAALALRLNLKDPALAKAFKNSQKGLGNQRIDFYKLEKQRNFEVSLVQFEKGERIAHHDHPGMTGVLLCATGNVDVWNYDLLDEKKDSKNVLLAETAQSKLTKGMVSTLTSKKRNIHRLQAHSHSRQAKHLIPVFISGSRSLDSMVTCRRWGT